ncbi:MAG: signal peptidase I [Patescibacteria group bacterium]
MIEVNISKRDWSKLFRNIWLVSVIVFAGGFIVFYIGPDSPPYANLLIITFLASFLSGSISFLLWMTLFVDKILVKKFPKYRRWIVAGLVVASVVCIAFLVGLSRFTLGVDGNSMYPAIQDKNNVLVNRWAYKSSLPQRGDIVVYKRFGNSGYFQEAIGRIIGMPDETITIKEGYIFISEQKLDEDYLLKGISTNGRSFLQEGQPYHIPSGQFIILGDNRDYSWDSREHGLLSKENILGKIFYRYWPLNSKGYINTK